MYYRYIVIRSLLNFVAKSEIHRPLRHKGSKPHKGLLGVSWCPGGFVAGIVYYLQTASIIPTIIRLATW